MDEWPDHPKPWFRKALTSARVAGWWYRKAAGSAHIHGTAFCKRANDSSALCRFPVFSSGSAGETKAQELERLIRRCPHNRESADELTAATVQMEKVERLCQGAEALLDMCDYEQEVIDLLDEADHLLKEAGRGVAEVDDLLCKAYDTEVEARTASEHAEHLLTSASTNLRDPGPVLDLAEGTASQVKSALSTARPSAQARALKGRVTRARVKIQELRTRLCHK